MRTDGHHPQNSRFLYSAVDITVKVPEKAVHDEYTSPITTTMVLHKASRKN